MNALKTAAIAILIGLVYGCSHPIEIVGEGDVLSASGMRNCYYEDFLAGAENCSKNLVVHEYVETYYAAPRKGWEFKQWLNYCTNSNSDECAFNIPPNVVKNSWGATVPSLVAVFTKTAPPPPEPVAMYSYALDAAGNLLNPQPLEGAQLQRKSVYFSFTGEYSKATFWCCKVPDGTEAHNEKVDDLEAPFVLRVDLGALPDDAGLARELYADLFTSATDYTSHTAYWTLDSPTQADVVFDDGGVHTIDYTIPGRVIVENATTVNVLDGAKLLYGASVIGSTLKVYGGEIAGEIFNFDSQVDLYGGKSDLISQLGDTQNQGSTKTTVFDGTVGFISASFGGTILVEGGSVGGIGANNALLTISNGNIGSIFVEASSLIISGGTFNKEIRFDHLYKCEYNGGEFFGLIEGAFHLNAGCVIKGGQFAGGFHYYGDLRLPTYTFYGDLAQSEPVVVGVLTNTNPLSAAHLLTAVPCPKKSPAQSIPPVHAWKAS